jgi:hypothetical protein
MAPPLAVVGSPRVAIRRVLAGGSPKCLGGGGAGRGVRRTLRGKRGVVQTREEPSDAAPWIHAGGNPTRRKDLNAPEADAPPFWSQEVSPTPQLGWERVGRTGERIGRHPCDPTVPARR